MSSKSPVSSMSRFKRIGRVILIVLLIAGFVYWLDAMIFGFPSTSPGDPYPPQFTLSKETSYFTGPLDKWGYVDYAKALNEMLSVGIEPEENIIVALLSAIGPKPYGKALTPEFFTWLHASSPKQSDTVHTPLEEFLKSNKEIDAQKINELKSREILQAQVNPWQPKDRPEIFAWLKKNESALACAVTASRKTQFFYPLVPIVEAPAGNGSVEIANLSVIQVYRELGIGLRCRAMLEVAEGRFDEAREDLLAVHRLSRLMTRCALMSVFVIGRSMDRFAFEGDEQLLEKANFPRKKLDDWNRALQALPERTPLVSPLNLGERAYYLESAMLMNQIGPSEYYLHKLDQDLPDVKNLYRISNVPLDYNLTLEKINENIDLITDCIREKSFPEIDDRLKSVYQEAKNKVQNNRETYLYDMFSLKYYKKTSLPIKHVENLFLLMVNEIRRCVYVDSRGLEREDLLRVALALEIHRKDRGVYPEKLGDLVPAFLAKVPGDRFSRADLIYRKTADGYLLYSVGANGKDEEGRGPDDEPVGDDLMVVRPKPKAEMNP